MPNARPWDERRQPQSDPTPSPGAASARRLDADSQPMPRLLKIIEGEIIPRLLLAHQSACARKVSDAAARAAAKADEVTEFVNLLLGRDFMVAAGYIQAMSARGVPLEKIYLELLAPAARLLGEMWDEDLRSFADVASGLCRMRQLLHELSPAFVNAAQCCSHGQRALLVPLPGEHHTFGLIMVGEFFRRAGWDVWDTHPASTAELQTAVRSHWFSVIGLSLSCEARISELAPLIRRLRDDSRNPGVRVMVGGQQFVGRADLVAAVGADGGASDARRAAIEARKLLAAGEIRV
jgi:MerR family transcriptional regulator, light-induced transcriptional regulator